MSIHRNRLIALSLALVAALPAAAQYPGSKPVPSSLETGFNAVSLADVRGWLEKLAGPEFGGRGTGQKGFDLAAQWVADRFKEAGLKPIGPNGDYFQPVPHERTSVDASATALTLGGAKLGFGKDFVVTGGDSEISAPVVVITPAADAALTAEQRAELEGKIVIIDTRGLDSIPAARPGRGGAGPRPAIRMTVVKSLPTPEPSVRYNPGGANPGGGPRPGGFLSGSITEEALTSLMADEKAWSNGEKPYKESAAKATLTVKVQTENVGIPNVVGLFEGSDPELKNEVVAIGCHLDHLGTRNGVMYPGADDDGSGTTALIAVAKMLQANPVKPKRSILFIAFTGEEMGLNGSRWYSDNPLIPMEKTLALFQMDMVGRNEEKPNEKAEDNEDTIHLVGSKRISTGLHEHVLKINEHVNFQFEYDEEGVYTRSDHYNFARKGVPIAFFFSGLHPDYHQPTDTPDKINYTKLLNAAKLAYLLVSTTADREKMFDKDVSGGG